MMYMREISLMERKMEMENIYGIIQENDFKAYLIWIKLYQVKFMIY